MKLFSKIRNYLFGLSVLLLMFGISVNIRKNDLSAEIGRHHEWITAHALITMEIWENNGGPAAFGFNPVYTYPEGYVFPRRSLGGVTDENGLNYYVSYPPFAFIFGYYASKLLGGPDVGSLRILNLTIHFFCGFFLWLIFMELEKIRTGWGESRFWPNFPGLITAGIYFFSCGTLWAHGVLYFVDTLGQLWFVVLIWMVIRLFLNSRKSMSFFMALFLLTFVASYTEWIGIFLAFTAGIGFLASFFISRNRAFLRAFFTMGIASAIALSLTIVQYSSIAGWESLYKASVEKYEERGGHVTDNPRLQHHADNPETFEMIRLVFDEQYSLAERMTAWSGFGLAVVLIIPVLRRKMCGGSHTSLLLSLSFLAILIHYFLFLNFNALHDFSAVKFCLLCALGTGSFIFLILTSFSKVFVQWIVGTGALALLVILIPDSYQRYSEKYTSVPADLYWISSCRKIAGFQDPQCAIFIDKPYRPQSAWRIKRDYYPAYDTLVVFNFMLGWHIPRAQYFIHEGSKLVAMTEYECVEKDVKIVEKVNF